MEEEAGSREMKKAGSMEGNAEALTKVIPEVHSRAHLMSLQRKIKSWTPADLDTWVNCALPDRVKKM